MEGAATTHGRKCAESRRPEGPWRGRNDGMRSLRRDNDASVSARTRHVTTIKWSSPASTQKDGLGWGWIRDSRQKKRMKIQDSASWDGEARAPLINEGDRCDLCASSSSEVVLCQCRVAYGHQPVSRVSVYIVDSPWELQLILTRPSEVTLGHEPRRGGVKDVAARHGRETIETAA